MDNEVNKGLEKEIGDIIEMAPVAPVGEQAPIEPPKEEVKEDAAKGEERKEEETSEQEPAESKSTEESAKEEVIPPAMEQKPSETPAPPTSPAQQESEVDRLKRENEEFRRSLSEMAERMVTPPQPKPKTQEQLRAEEEARKKIPPQILRFIPNEEAFDEVMKTADGFNAVLTGVFNAAVQHTLRLVPQVATNLVDSQINLRTTATEFYQANPDLVPHKKYVGFVANELAAQHADWDLATLLKESEKEVRSRLKLAPAVNVGQVAQNVQQGRTVQQNPGFVPGAGGGGRRGSAGADRLTGTEKDIIDLIS